MYRYFVILVLLLTSSCFGNPNQKHVFSVPLMYTQFDIVLYSSLPKSRLQKEVDKVWKELNYWFIELSPAGEASAAILNSNQFLPANRDLKSYTAITNFITQAKKINKTSKGAFDLTVYPLVRLWGFYQQDTNRRPSPEEIKNVLKYIGMDKVHISNDGVYLEQGVRLDYGAVAKGFAVDVAVTMLTNVQGINAGFVNAGGNLRVFGVKPDKTDWTVGVRDPNGQEVQEVIPVYEGESVATSGDYEQFFRDQDGSYYHHIFNPLTGYPASHGLASVSVIVKDSAEMADILSTTFLSSGREETYRIIKELGIEDTISVFFIERKGAELFSYANENWLKRKAEK